MTSQLQARNRRLGAHDPAPTPRRQLPAARRLPEHRCGSVVRLGPPPRTSMWQRCSPANIVATAMSVITRHVEHRCDTDVRRPRNLGDSGVATALAADTPGGIIPVFRANHSSGGTSCPGGPGATRCDPVRPGWMALPSARGRARAARRDPRGPRNKLAWAVSPPRGVAAIAGLKAVGGVGSSPEAGARELGRCEGTRPHPTGARVVGRAGGRD